MTAPATPFLIPKKSQDAIIAFYRACCQMSHQSWNLRYQMREIDLAYQREMDYTKEQQRAKLANRLGDPNKYQNITIPVVLPQVESAVTYQTSVFLTGNPIFGVVSSPENQNEAVQMETIIESQATLGGWPRELMMFFRDGFKYNTSGVEVPWCREVTAELTTDATYLLGKQARPKEIIWEGNKLNRWDPYNSFFDKRVAPADVAKYGEFAGRVQLKSRIALKQFIAELPDRIVDNIIPAFNSSTSAIGLWGTSGGEGDVFSYYHPLVNPDAYIEDIGAVGTNWASWAGISGSAERGKIDYKDIYELSTFYARILPSDFNLRVPQPNTPQIWKFYIVNHQHIIYVERQTNAHNMIPVLFGQPLEDGLGYQTKSLAKNVLPVQQVSTALMNSVIAARRRAISDRGLYDPSRVTEAAINSDNPSAKIPVKPSAYGKPLSEAYYPIPFRDENSSMILQELNQMSSLANLISGQNPVRQGQFVKGNKTTREFSDVMANANGRDQLTSLLYEYQVFTPLKHILKSNILQYQAGVSLYSRSRKQEVEIDPVILRERLLEFKISDGLIPSEKLIDGDVLQVAMQVIGTSPQINAEYNLGPLFSYLMKTQGADLSAFEKSPEQVAYEQAVQQWQQVVLEAIKAGAPPQNLPPQPVPQNYGYDPAKFTATPPIPQPKVNNITNNITNNGERFR